MRAWLVVLVLGLVLPATANAVTVTFDDLAPGTEVTNQYASAGGPGQGVVFGARPGGPPGLKPRIAAVGAGVANSGTQVGDLANCPGCEFYVPGTSGTFQTLRTAVSVRVGLLGTGEPSVTTLTAYDAAGLPVGSPATATLSPGAGVKTLLAVTSPTTAIAGFTVSQRDSDTNKQIAIDDLTFETGTGAPPPTPDFSLTAAQTFVNIRAGQTVTDELTIGRFGASNGPVSFAVSGAPTGITATVAPNPANGTQATLTITAAPDVAPTGNTLPRLTVTGSSMSAGVGLEPRSVTIELQIKEAFNVRYSGPADVQLAPCSVDIPIAVTRDFSLTTPVDLTVTGAANGIGATLSKSQATFPNGAGGETIILTAKGNPTGKPVGPATFTVTGHSAGLPDRSVSVTVTGTCPAGYDARITSMMITQGVQTTYLPTFAEHANGEFSYLNFPDAARLRQNAPTVVRVYADLGSGPAEGVQGIPVTLFGGAFNRIGSAISLPGSPLLPVSGARTLKLGPETPPNSELSSETEVYTFVLPDSWTQQESIGVGAQILPTQQTAQPQRVVAPCDTAACAANDSMRIRQIPLDPVRKRTIRPVRLSVAGTTLPDPNDVFAYTRLVYPVRLKVEPYYGTIDITGIANGAGTNREKDKKAMDALGEWSCDHSLPDDGWAVGVYTGVGNGLQRNSTACYLPPRNPKLAVVEYKRPLSSSSHEFGHLLGLNHASGGCDADKETSPYDDWPPDQQGFTQASGLDLRQGSGINSGPFAVMSEPSKNWFDAMSYCGDNSVLANFLSTPASKNKWLSVRNWNKVFDSVEDTSRVAPLRPRQAQPSLRVTGYGAGASAEITSVTPLDAGPAEPSSSPFHLLGLDKDGKTVADVGMQEANQHVDGDVDDTVLGGVIPSAGVVAVAIARDGAIIVRRDASANAPRVTVSRKPRFRGGRAMLRWFQDDADGDPLKTSVEYAPKGRPFERIWMGFGGTSATVPASYLPRARSARLRVTVNDGFLQTAATSKPFRSPGAAPSVRILSPLSGATQPVDAPLNLTGEAFDDAGTLLTGRRLVWRAGRRVLGRGESVAATGMRAGAQRITLAARDRYGRVGRASVRVRMQGATPVLLDAKVVRRRGRRVTLRVASSLPARLVVRRRRFRVDREPRKVKVKVARTAARLRLRVAAGGRASVQTLTI